MRSPGTVAGVARSLHDRHGGRVGRVRLRAVALVGIDGSGKTTQAHRLADALTAAGHPASYWQNAGGRRWFGRLARRLGRDDAQRLLGRDLLLLAESVLRWCAIARALVRSALTRRIAVMDRYAVCQYASIRAHSRFRWEPLVRLLYRIFPAPELTILLAVDPAEAYRRIELRATDHESPEYLAAADAAYRSLPEFPTFVVVDANRPPDEVSRAIERLLHGWLRPAVRAPRPEGPDRARPEAADRLPRPEVSGRPRPPERPEDPTLDPRALGRPAVAASPADPGVPRGRSRSPVAGPGSLAPATSPG